MDQVRVVYGAKICGVEACGNDYHLLPHGKERVERGVELERALLVKRGLKGDRGRS